MKKNLLLSLLCGLAFQLTAQQKFIGTVTYKMTTFNNQWDDVDGNPPYKVILGYGGNLLAMRMYFANKPPQLIVVNTQKDTVYITNPEDKTYFAQSLTAMDGTKITTEKTDSFRNYFGYRCRGLRSFSDDGSETYAWVVEDLTGIEAKDSYKNNFIAVLGAPYVMLGMDAYDKEANQREASMIAESINKMESLPDSLYDLSGYREIDLTRMLQAARDSTNISDVMVDTTGVFVMPDTVAVKKPPVRKPVNKKTPAKKPSATTKSAARKPNH